MPKQAKRRRQVVSRPKKDAPLVLPVEDEETLRRQRQRQERREALKVLLGVPHLWLPFANRVAGIGYWRTEGGLVSYEVDSQGYPIEVTRRSYTDSLVQQMYDLLQRDPK